MKVKMTTKKKYFFQHPFFSEAKTYTKEHPFVKFLIVLSIFITYLIFSMFKFGVDKGILVSFLSWSFFVFCTPIADAGILVDFPVRLFTGIRMLFSEMMVWVIAFFLNIFTLTFNPNIYDKTILLTLFKQILTHPFPYWIIILLSCIGTFLSIHFGDEILDIISFKKKSRTSYARHIQKYRLIVFVFIIIFIIVLYYFLLNNLGINIPLI